MMTVSVISISFLLRVRTEIGKQNSRTYPGLFNFKEFLYFFKVSFSLTVTQLMLLIRRISFPSGIVNTFPLRAHCFCLISALVTVLARYFCCCLSGFPLCKVSLPVPFNLYYMYLYNRIEYHSGTTTEDGTTLCFLLPISKFS